jgi:hypothetical protein
VVASTNPVVIGSGVVGLVVGVSRGVVELAGLGVLAGGLGVEGSSGLAVESLEHDLQGAKTLSSHCNKNRFKLKTAHTEMSLDTLSGLRHSHYACQ